MKHFLFTKSIKFIAIFILFSSGAGISYAQFVTPTVYEENANEWTVLFEFEPSTPGSLPLVKYDAITPYSFQDTVNATYVTVSGTTYNFSVDSTNSPDGLFRLWIISDNGSIIHEGNYGVNPNADPEDPEDPNADPGSGEGTVLLQNPIGVNNFPEFIKRILDIVLTIGIPIVALAIIYSGFLFVVARGNSEKLKVAKETLLYTIIGAAILLGSWVIASAISTTVTSLM